MKFHPRRLVTRSHVNRRIENVAISRARWGVSPPCVMALSLVAHRVSGECAGLDTWPPHRIRHRLTSPTFPDRSSSDGSSTVGPITTAAAENFSELAPNVEIEVSISGTGGGFSRFCEGETDIQNASRPINEEEAAICAENGIDYYEFEIAYDGITIVVPESNTFLTCISTESLAAIWNGEITNFNQIDPSYPDLEIKLFGADSESGTYDYFNEQILGEDDAGEVIEPSASYEPSSDDNVLVEGVAAPKADLVTSGSRTSRMRRIALNAVAVTADGDMNNCVVPSADTDPQPGICSAQPPAVRLCEGCEPGREPRRCKNSCATSSPMRRQSRPAQARLMRRQRILHMSQQKIEGRLQAPRLRTARALRLQRRRSNGICSRWRAPHPERRTRRCPMTSRLVGVRSVDRVSGQPRSCEEDGKCGGGQVTPDGQVRYCVPAQPIERSRLDGQPKPQDVRPDSPCSALSFAVGCPF